MVGIAHRETGPEQRQHKRTESRQHARRQQRRPEHELDDFGHELLQFPRRSGAVNLRELRHGERHHRERHEGDQAAGADGGEIDRDAVGVEQPADHQNVGVVEHHPEAVDHQEAQRDREPMAGVERGLHLGQLPADSRIDEEALRQRGDRACSDQRPKRADRVGRSAEQHQTADENHQQERTQDVARNIRNMDPAERTRRGLELVQQCPNRHAQQSHEQGHDIVGLDDVAKREDQTCAEQCTRVR